MPSLLDKLNHKNRVHKLVRRVQREGREERTCPNPKYPNRVAYYYNARTGRKVKSYCRDNRNQHTRKAVVRLKNPHYKRTSIRSRRR